MTIRISKQALDDLTEKLAYIEHERWSHWQRYVHDHGRRQPDGSLSIPAELADRWQRQFETQYSALNAEEKQSDRDQVARYLPTVLAALDIQADGTDPER